MTTNPEPQAQADASLGEIKRQIIYKGQGQHCEVQLAHQFYPSSKTYSNCSNVNAKLKREPRWQCPSCGMNHDRNIDAGVNLHELLTLPPDSGVKLRDGKALTVGTPHGETSPDQRACQRHTTVHQTGQKTGHRSLQQAVSYSEIPLKSSTPRRPQYLHHVTQPTIPVGFLMTATPFSYSIQHIRSVIMAPTRINVLILTLSQTGQRTGQKSARESDHDRQSRGRRKTAPTHQHVHQVHRPANTPRGRPRRQRAEHYCLHRRRRTPQGLVATHPR